MIRSQLGHLVCLSPSLKDTLANVIRNDIIVINDKLKHWEGTINIDMYHTQEVIDDSILKLRLNLYRLKELGEIVDEIHECSGQHKGAHHVWSGEL